MTLSPATFFQSRRDQFAVLKMFLPVGVVLAAALSFAEFLVGAIEGNLVVNSAIISVSLYGILLIYARLFSAQRDMRALERFSVETKAGSDMNALLDQPWLKNLSIRQYLEPIAQTEGTLASQLDQNAIENELEALSAEYNSKMELPQFLVGFMVAMGLLGTFIGLLETLTGISGMLNGMGQPGADIEQQFTKLVAELRKPLSGMGMAFSASMFGLVASLMLSIMMISLRRYINGILGKARLVMHDLTTRVAVPVNHFLQNGANASPVPVAAQGAYADYSEVSADGVKAEPLSITVREMMAHTHNAMLQVTDSVSALLERMDQIGSAQSATDRVTVRLGDLIERIEGLVSTHNDENKAVDTMERLIKRVDAMIEARDAEIASNTTVSSTSLMGGDGEESVVPRIISTLKNLATAQTEGQKNAERMVESLTEIDQKFMTFLAETGSQRKHNEEIIKLTRDLTHKIDETAAAFRTVGDSAVALAPALDRKLTPFTNATRESVIVQQQSSAKLDELYNLSQDSLRNLMEIKDGLIKSTATFSQMDGIADNTGRLVLLLESSLEGMMSSQKTLVTTLQHDLKSFTRELAQLMGVTLKSES